MIKILMGLAGLWGGIELLAQGHAVGLIILLVSLVVVMSVSLGRHVSRAGTDCSSVVIGGAEGDDTGCGD